MHELSVTESLLEIALRHAQGASARRISDLYIVIGQMASIVDDSVQFYWDMISQGTLAEGAHLHFQRIPAELLCLDCGQKYSPGKEDILCNHCGGARAKVVSGEEFYLDSIEIES